MVGADSAYILLLSFDDSNSIFPLASSLSGLLYHSLPVGVAVRAAFRELLCGNV